MNSCNFIGRMATDPEIKTTQSGKTACSFRLAVQRRYKDANGNYPADFIPCVAWEHNANFISRFIRKGEKLGLRGELQIRSYQAQDGSTRYVSEIIVAEVDLCSAQQARQTEGMQQTAQTGAVQQAQAVFGAEYVEIEDAELPF